MEGAWVRSLVRELRFHMPPGIAKKKVYNNKKETEYTEFSPYGDREEEDKDGKKVQNGRKGKEEKI